MQYCTAIYNSSLLYKGPFCQSATEFLSGFVEPTKYFLHSQLHVPQIFYWIAFSFVYIACTVITHTYSNVLNVVSSLCCPCSSSKRGKKR